MLTELQTGYVGLPVVRQKTPVIRKTFPE